MMPSINNNGVVGSSLGGDFQGGIDDFIPYPPIDGVETPNNRIKPKKNIFLYFGIGVAVLTAFYLIFKN
jgi:hypothetical protein